MKLEGTYTIAAPRQYVWDVMLNPALLAQVLPGCEALDALGDDRYKARVKIQMGPLQGVFDGTITLSEIHEPESYRMDFDGKGGLGFVKGSGSVAFSEQDGATLVHYAGDAAVGGRIATVGQRLIETSAKALIQQTFDLVAPIAQSMTPPPADPLPPTIEQTAELSAAPIAAPAPSLPPKLKTQTQTMFAVGVTKHVLADVIPVSYRTPLLISAAIILVVIAVLIAFSAH